MQTFMGIPMQQMWEDVNIWETFFRDYPVRTFVELGTGWGGMSLYFALQCYQRGIVFHTYDNQKNFDVEKGLHGALGYRNCFHNIDIFGEAPHEAPAIRALIESCPRPMAIFFDNGDKPREWKYFAPLTHPGDFCVVHDWNYEFFEKDLLDVSVERILTDYCNTRPPGWHAMWFKRV